VKVRFVGRFTLKWFKEKKKKPSFRKIEDGMVFESEDGEVVAVGFPTEVEKKTMGEGGVKVGAGGVGGEAGAERYSRIKYDWRYLSGSPLSPEKKKEYDEQIATASGTIVADSANLTPLNVDVKVCENCGYKNLNPKGFCSSCGKNLD